jgi:hypothetical protein
MVFDVLLTVRCKLINSVPHILPLLFLKCLLVSRLTSFRLFPFIIYQFHYFIFSLFIIPKSSKAEILFQISIQYCSLPSASFNFLRLNFSICNHWDLCLFTGSLSVNFCYHQIVVSITDTRMPIYQNKVNVIVGFLTRRRPCIFMDVAMWEHRTLDSEVFRCGKVHYSNSTVITKLV